MPLEEPLFSELLQRLDGESGMRRKVRLLAGSWSLLRELSAEQRQQLALAVGNRWAWRNIETLFGNSRQLSDNQREVKEFFESMRETDPRELRTIGREIKDGNFATVQSRVMGALEEALEEEIDSEDNLPEPVEPVPEPSRPAPEEPGERPSVAPTPAEPEESPIAQPAVARPEERDPTPELEPKPQPEPADITFEQNLVEDAPFYDNRRDATALSGVDSLRLLRRLSSGQISSTRAGRAAMVGSLASGWAARRAVSSIIRSHSVADVDEALALIRRLPTATQQTWCLGDLVQHWDLDDDARGRVLAAAPTESVRSRLALRARLAVDRPL